MHVYAWVTELLRWTVRGTDRDKNREKRQKGEMGERQSVGVNGGVGVCVSRTLCQTNCFKSKVYQSVSRRMAKSGRQGEVKRTAQRKGGGRMDIKLQICAATGFPNCLAYPGDHG